MAGELFEHEVALGLAEALHNDLFGGLRSNAPSVFRCFFDVDCFADLGVGSNRLGFIEGYFERVVIYLFDDQFGDEDPDFAGGREDSDRDVIDLGLRILALLLECRNEGSFDCAEHDFGWQPTLGCQLGHCQQEIALHRDAASLPVVQRFQGQE